MVCHILCILARFSLSRKQIYYFRLQGFYPQSDTKKAQEILVKIIKLKSGEGNIKLLSSSFRQKKMMRTINKIKKEKDRTIKKNQLCGVMFWLLYTSTWYSNFKYPNEINQKYPMNKWSRSNNYNTTTKALIPTIWGQQQL